jgi:hypothetical protein
MRRDKPNGSVAFTNAEPSSPTAMPVRPARMRRLYVAQAGFETRSKGTGFAHKPRLGGKGDGLQLSETPAPTPTPRPASGLLQQPLST